MIDLHQHGACVICKAHDNAKVMGTFGVCLRSWCQPSCPVMSHVGHVTVAMRVILPMAGKRAVKAVAWHLENLGGRYEQSPPENFESC